MTTSPHHSEITKQQQLRQKQHPPILSSPTSAVHALPSRPPLQNAIKPAIAGVGTLGEHFHSPSSLPTPITPRPTFQSFPAPLVTSQAATLSPQKVGLTHRFPEIKPFIQLGPSSSTKSKQRVRPNSISFAPSRENVEPVHVFHHGSPLFLSEIRKIEVTSQPPTLIEVTSQPPTLLSTRSSVTTSPILDSLDQRGLQVHKA